MTAHGPVRSGAITMDGADGEEDRARTLEQLRLRTRQLESQRIVASPTMNRAWLVALDVELCRVEAAARMLALPDPSEVIDPPLPGLSWLELSSSRPEHGEALLTRGVLCDRPGTTPESDRREDRRRLSRTQPLGTR